MGIYVDAWLIHFSVQQKVTQHCKATILRFFKKVVFFLETIPPVSKLCPEEICVYQRYLRPGPSTPFSIPNTLFSYHSPITGLNQILFCFVLFSWPCCAAYGILVSPTRDSTQATAVKAVSPNHWASRELPEPKFQNLQSPRQQNKQLVILRSQF